MPTLDGENVTPADVIPGEEEAPRGAEAGGWAGTPSRALHERVDITLDILVQRQCSARRHEGSYEHMDDPAKSSVCRAPRSIRRACCQTMRRTRLAERDEIAGHLRPIARGRRIMTSTAGVIIVDHVHDGEDHHHTPSRSAVPGDELDAFRVNGLSAPEHAKTTQGSADEPEDDVRGVQPTSG